MRFFLKFTDCQTLLRYKLLLFLSLSLTACLTPSDPVFVPPESQPQQAQKVKKTDAEIRRDQIGRLLASAERAMAAGRLMLPLADNAYDRYRAVLLLQPGNPQAASGLDEIVVRYVQMAQQAISRSRWSEAQEFIARAAEISADNPLLREVIEAFERARSVQVASHAGEQFFLDPDQLNNKSESLMLLLIEIAQRLRQSHESMVIVARTDREGRWLYKQMKQAAQGYRIRGDITVGPQPKIIILPPL